jgi:YD repeat-containing protein
MAGQVLEEDLTGNVMAQQYVWDPNGVNSLIQR